MADAHHTPETTHDYTRDADKPGALVAVWAAVIILAGVNIGLSMMGMGKFALPVQLAIASVQAGIVAYYFMHLKQGERVLILTALASIFWTGILFVLFMADYMTRHMVIGW